MAIIRAKRKAGYLLFSIALAILFFLGGWQFQRGQEKANIERLGSLSDSQYAIIDEAPVNWETLAYQSAALHGRWLGQRYFLMDNWLHKGQPGYEVLVPFELSADGTIMLVNRGWVSRRGASNLTLPDSEQERVVRGQLYLPQKGFTLGSTYSGEVRWPLTILYYDMAVLSKALGSNIDAAVLVLDPSDGQSLVRIWQPGNVAPARHYGYAVQWWGLALTLIIFGFIWRRSADSKQLNV